MRPTLSGVTMEDFRPIRRLSATAVGSAKDISFSFLVKLSQGSGGRTSKQASGSFPLGHRISEYSTSPSRRHLDGIWTRLLSSTPWRFSELYQTFLLVPSADISKGHFMGAIPIFTHNAPLCITFAPQRQQKE